MKTAWKSLSDFPPNCHKLLTDFFFHSFFFQLRLIKWSSCLFFPLPTEAKNTNFGETYSSFASLPLFHTTVDGQPLGGLVLPAQVPLFQQGSSLAPVGLAAGCQLLGSQAQPGHTCQGMGTANRSGTCWLTAFLLCVCSHTVSWMFRGDFSVGWWHRNSLCASVHWPDEPGQTQWQTWWTLQKLPKRELVADLELLTWSKPWATQWLLLFSWLPQIAAWRQECSISGFCFLIFY